MNPKKTQIHANSKVSTKFAVMVNIFIHTIQKLNMSVSRSNPSPGLPRSALKVCTVMGGAYQPTTLSRHEFKNEAGDSDS